MFSQWYQEFTTLDFVINVLLKVDDGYCGPNVWPFYLLSHRRCKHRGIIKHTNRHGYKNHIRSAGLCNFTSLFFGHKDKIEQEYTEKNNRFKEVRHWPPTYKLVSIPCWSLSVFLFCVWPYLSKERKKKKLHYLSCDKYKTQVELATSTKPWPLRPANRLLLHWNKGGKKKTFDAFCQDRFSHWTPNANCS